MMPEQQMEVFTGYHKEGIGQAHLYNDQHTTFFNRRMVSTFNVGIDRPFNGMDLYPAKRQRVEGCLKWYHLFQIENETDRALAFSFHWEGSAILKRKMVLELVSRKPLPSSFQHGLLKLTHFKRWFPNQIADWAEPQYWFQTFPWSPKRKADSRLVWDAITNSCNWSNRTVLDIGTHYGYHAIRASEAGADVIGFEPDPTSYPNAVIIDRHIEQQGIEYVTTDPGGCFDVILYLSVHHQIDPSYDGLQAKIEELRARCKDLFVELILPSSYSEFGNGRSDSVVDSEVGGVVLRTYKHRVRATRRIYHVQGTKA